MALNETLYATKDPIVSGTNFQNADGTSYKTIYTNSTGEAVRIMAIAINSTDTVARDLIFAINDGSTDYPLHHVDIPIAAGTNGTANAVDALNVTNAPFIPFDHNGNRYFDLANGHSIKGKMIVAVTAATRIDVTIIGAEYLA